MGRPLRIDHPGTYHHVTNRGRNKQDVFGDDEDRELFLDYLHTTISLGLIELHSFALMSNHYHLLIRSCAEHGLSRTMQLIGSGYTLDFNRKYGFDGALFKGRFFSKLIDNERYLMEVPRYIANNPVKAGLVRRPEDYRWSSHAALLGHPNAVDIPVARDIVTTYFDGDARSFDRFVRRLDTNQAVEFARVVHSQLPDRSLQSSLDTIHAAQQQFNGLTLRSPSLLPLATTLIDYVCSSLDVASATSDNLCVVPPDRISAPFVAESQQGTHYGFDTAPSDRRSCLRVDTPNVARHGISIGILLPHDDATQAARGLLLTLLHRSNLATLTDLAAAFGFGFGQGASRSIRRFEGTARQDPALATLLNTGLSLINRAA
jgi:REP element-mobilizing transposase RayT